MSFETDLDSALSWCEAQVLASADVRPPNHEVHQAIESLLAARGHQVAGVNPKAELAFLQVFAEHFGGTDLTTLLPLVKYASFSKHTQGEVLHWAVPPIESAAMLVVVGGTAEQYLTPTSTQKVSELAVGVLFGVEEFFTGTCSEHVYKAGAGGCSVAKLTSDTVQQLETEDPQLAQHFHQMLCRHMASRLQKANSTSVNCAPAVHLELPAPAPSDVVDSVANLMGEHGLIDNFKKKD